jgi:hypothetical protein
MQVKEVLSAEGAKGIVASEWNSAAKWGPLPELIRLFRRKRRGRESNTRDYSMEITICQ